MTRCERTGETGRVRRGFTLLEVIIALAVFALAIVYFNMAYLNTLTAMSRVQVNQSLEQDLATVRQQVLLMSDPEELEMGGDVVTGEHGLARWDVEYEPTELADLFRVTLSVELEPKEDGSGEETEGPIEVTETFYLTRPSWSEPVEREELRERTRQRLVEKQTGRSR